MNISIGKHDQSMWKKSVFVFFFIFILLLSRWFGNFPVVPQLVYWCCDKNINIKGNQHSSPHHIAIWGISNATMLCSLPCSRWTKKVEIEICAAIQASVLSSYEYIPLKMYVGRIKHPSTYHRCKTGAEQPNVFAFFDNIFRFDHSGIVQAIRRTLKRTQGDAMITTVPTPSSSS